MLGGFIAFWAFFRLLRAALIDAPQWIVGFFACCCLSLIVWLHRRSQASCNLSGGVVAATLLAAHQIDTKVYRVEGWMADCYFPKKNAILLSPANFEGTTVSALGIAAHEVGHVLQRKRWYAPYCLTWLIRTPAHAALAACFWLWLIGAAAEVQPFVLAAVGCFAIYLLYLLLELVCEIDASRRGVRELLHHGLLRKGESRVARRILRVALGSYFAVFAVTALALSFLVPQVHWRDLLNGRSPTIRHVSPAHPFKLHRAHGGRLITSDRIPAPLHSPHWSPSRMGNCAVLLRGHITIQCGIARVQCFESQDATPSLMLARSHRAFLAAFWPSFTG